MISKDWKKFFFKTHTRAHYTKVDQWKAKISFIVEIDWRDSLNFWILKFGLEIGWNVRFEIQIKTKTCRPQVKAFPQWKRSKVNCTADLEPFFRAVFWLSCPLLGFFPTASISSSFRLTKKVDLRQHRGSTLSQHRKDTQNVDPSLSAKEFYFVNLNENQKDAYDSQILSIGRGVECEKNKQTGRLRKSIW